MEEVVESELISRDWRVVWWLVILLTILMWVWWSTQHDSGSHMSGPKSVSKGDSSSQSSESNEDSRGDLDMSGSLLNSLVGVLDGVDRRNLSLHWHVNNLIVYKWLLIHNSLSIK
jgi:hypothetical protein